MSGSESDSPKELETSQRNGTPLTDTLNVVRDMRGDRSSTGSDNSISSPLSPNGQVRRLLQRSKRTFHGLGIPPSPSPIDTTGSRTPEVQDTLAENRPMIETPTTPRTQFRIEIRKKKDTYIAFHQNIINNLRKEYTPESIQELKHGLQEYDQIHQRIQERIRQESDPSQRREIRAAYTEIQDAHVEKITGRSQRSEATITLDDIRKLLQYNTQQLRNFETEFLKDTYLKQHQSAIDNLRESEKPKNIQELERGLQTYGDLHQRIQKHIRQESDPSQRILAQEAYIEIQASHVKEVGWLREDPELSTYRDIRLQLLYNTLDLMNFETTYLKETYLKQHQFAIDNLHGTDNPESIQHLERTLQAYDQTHQRIQERIRQESDPSQRILAQEAYIELQYSHVGEITGRSQSTEATITLDDIREQLKYNTEQLRAFDISYLNKKYLKQNQDTIDDLSERYNSESIQYLEHILQDYDQIHQRIQNLMGKELTSSRRIQAQEAYTELQYSHLQMTRTRSEDSDIPYNDIILQLRLNREGLKRFERRYLPQDSPSDNNQS